MFTDITGKKRLKAGLHTHTKRTDGRKTPEEAIAAYEEAGYDILALTDHWVYGESEKHGTIEIISGCEYNIEYYKQMRGGGFVFSESIGKWRQKSCTVIGLGVSNLPLIDFFTVPRVYADRA